MSSLFWHKETIKKLAILGDSENWLIQPQGVTIPEQFQATSGALEWVLLPQTYESPGWLVWREPRPSVSLVQEEYIEIFDATFAFSSRVENDVTTTAAALRLALASFKRGLEPTPVF